MYVIVYKSSQVVLAYCIIWFTPTWGSTCACKRVYVERVHPSYATHTPTPIHAQHAGITQ